MDIKNQTQLVQKGYDTIAVEYLSQREVFANSPALQSLVARLQNGSLILDIGCGAGLPLDKFLVDNGYQLIGIDISKRQIEFAQKNVPQAKFEVKNMLELKEGDYQVDAVVSFYAIFHIHRTRHQDLFMKISSFLPKGGLILVTMGSTNWEGTEPDFHGVLMYWSHYAPDRNRYIVQNAGFEILDDGIDKSGGERHQIIFARKKSSIR